MRVRTRSRNSPRASKRKHEVESSSVAPSEPQRKRPSKINESEQREPPNPMARCSTVFSSIMVDRYCWICHTETDDRICVTCHRAYHNDCLDKTSASFNDLGVCPECQNKSVDGTELNSNRYFNVDKLKRMLDVLTRRSFDKKLKKNEIFLQWPEEDRDKLFKIIDFEILLDNINHAPHYTKTAEFYGDVKFIYHNSCIIYGAHSDQAKAAENLRRDFKKELLHLEACPECYYHSSCDESDYSDPFVRLCDYPHDIVWAKLTGHPFWPSKCLKVVKGLAHVTFFGEHEQSNIPINKCYFMSKSHPNDINSNLRNPENSGPKSASFQSARLELLEYIRLYELKYKVFKFYDHKEPYNPQQKDVVSSAEGSSDGNKAEMKTESMNEDSEANDINAKVKEFSEGTSAFRSSSTNEIIGPNGQYVTCELSSIEPSPFTDGPAESGLLKKPSPVTSVEMSFSSDENPVATQNCPQNPVVTSIESLQPNESSSIVLSSSENNSLDCGFQFLENINGILHSESSVGSETVQCTEVLSETVGNTASNDSCIQQDALHNIMNNFPIFTENQDELDNEVQCIGEKRTMQEYESFNPDIVVPFLEENSPELKALLQKARYVTNGLIIDLWASVLKNPNNVGRISKVCGNLKKCRSDLKKMKEEIDRIKEEDAELKFKIKEQAKTFQEEKNSLLQEIRSEEAKTNEARENARKIIRSLKSGCHKKIEEMLKTQFMTTIKEKEDKLQDAENTNKNLEEEKRRLEKELEEATVAKLNAEDKLKVAKSQKNVYDRDTLREYKTKHYCCVCELTAAIVCCLDTSYCSIKCQKRDAENHQKKCRKEKPSQVIMQQTVHRTISVNVERTTNNPSNSEVPGTDSMTSSTDYKKVETHHVSAFPALPMPHDGGTPSSSRSFTPKSKRRLNR